MDIDKIIDVSIDEMYEFMKTDDFKKLVDKDATTPFVIEFLRIGIKNYHKELTKQLAAKGIQI